MTRVATVLACVALAASACSDGGGDVRGGPDRPPTPIRWLSAGDSFSSAEGVRGATDRCARSDRAFAPLARSLLVVDVPVDHFSHVACSGATLTDLPDQVAEALDAGGDRFNLVTMTAGGNDVGFARIVADCSGVDDVLDRIVGGRDAAGCDVPAAELLSRARRLGERLAAAYRSLVGGLEPGGVVVVLGYPTLHADPSTWEPGRTSCEGIAAADARLLREMAGALDAETAAAAAAFDRVHYVSVIEAFEGHELCGVQEPWLHGISLGVSARTFRPQSTYHPNEDGQAAMANLLVGELRELYGAG